MADHRPMQQLPLAIGLQPLATFDTYVPGANLAALHHLRTIAPGAAPCYLWGPDGVGKTHLLRALLHERHAAGRLKQGMARHLEIRRMPRLEFRLDDSLKRQAALDASLSGDAPDATHEGTP